MRDVLETPASRLRTEQSDRCNNDDITRRDRHEDADHAEVAQEERNQESRKAGADTAERVHESAGASANACREHLRLIRVVAHGQQLSGQADQNSEGDDQRSVAELREQRPGDSDDSRGPTGSAIAMMKEYHRLFVTVIPFSISSVGTQLAKP